MVVDVSPMIDWQPIQGLPHVLYDNVRCTVYPVVYSNLIVLYPEKKQQPNSSTKQIQTHIFICLMHLLHLLYYDIFTAMQKAEMMFYKQHAM